MSKRAARWHAPKMKPAVEILSATDSIVAPNRSVWYWVEYDGKKSERREDYKTVLAWAWALVAEHDTCLVDRSDKGSGFLLSTLGR
jgi:hypothetical protein